MVNILLVLNLVRHYKTLAGFEGLTKPLEVKIVDICVKLTMQDQYKFFQLHRADNPELINTLVVLMADVDEGDWNLCTFTLDGQGTHVPALVQLQHL